MTSCPNCNGPLMVDHPGGQLEYIHLPDPQCPLYAAEDATRAADLERHRDQYPFGFNRDATPTERILLNAQGFTVPPVLLTHVKHIVPGVRRRTWDHLAQPTTEGMEPA